MIFALTVLIPTTILWYQNNKNYKKINLIDTCTKPISISKTNPEDIESFKNIVINVDINSLANDPVVTRSSKMKWLALRTEEYKRIKINKINSFYPFRNETKILNAYEKTCYNSCKLNRVLGININPIMLKLFKKFQVRESPFIIHDNTKDEITDSYCLDVITKQDVGLVYYNVGINYDSKLRCTIIGKLKDGNVIDSDNCIIHKQDYIDVDVIKNKYYKKISNNKKWFTFLIATTLIFAYIEYKK